MYIPLISKNVLVMGSNRCIEMILCLFLHQYYNYCVRRSVFQHTGCWKVLWAVKYEVGPIPVWS